MNIDQRIRLNCDTTYPGYFETYQIGTPIPPVHPPSLKNAQPVHAPVAMDGWKKGVSKKKRKKAQQEMKQIVRKTLNQGRPTFVRHSKGMDPNLWDSSTIA